MLNPDTSLELPVWPSEIARLRDAVLEITAGDGIRVAERDILEIGVAPTRAGRLSLTLDHRTGLDRAKTSYRVEPEHAAVLQRLVDAVASTKEEA